MEGAVVTELSNLHYSRYFFGNMSKSNFLISPNIPTTVSTVIDMLHTFIGKVKIKKFGAFPFLDSILDRLSCLVNMSPDAVILQNTKKKSGHTYTMYMDNEIEGRLIGWGSFIGED